MGDLCQRGRRPFPQSEGRNVAMRDFWELGRKLDVAQDRCLYGGG